MVRSGYEGLLKSFVANENGALAFKGTVSAGGGTLVFMANDTANCEIKNFNELAGTFGIRFTDQSINTVQGNQFEQGRLDIPSGNPIFKRTYAVFVKELSVLDLKASASPVLSKGERKIIATTRFGKGRVFAMGDPWLYNEYTDGRKTPAVYENFIAGKDLANWLLQ